MIFRAFFLARAPFQVHSGVPLLAFGLRFFHCRLQNETVVPRVARIDGASRVSVALAWLQSWNVLGVTVLFTTMSNLARRVAVRRAGNRSMRVRSTSCFATPAAIKG